MVALQILALSVRVRVLLSQLNEKPPSEYSGGGFQIIVSPDLFRPTSKTLCLIYRYSSARTDEILKQVQNDKIEEYKVNQ